MKAHLCIPDEQTLGTMETAATEIASGDHFGYFLVPGTQGGVGTSINLNVNEIISMQLLNDLEVVINKTRKRLEQLENRYSNTYGFMKKLL